MAEETQQEREARWEAHRATRVMEHQNFQAERARARWRNWLVGGVIVLIVVVAAAIVLL